MRATPSFHQQLQDELASFINTQNTRYPNDDLLKIDLHCHDYNSDVPDEILGRILGVSETWLKTEDLISKLEKNGCNALTITNHNNSRSCQTLKEKGHDILVGAEFSVTVPDYKIGIHVLTYGFSPQQEKRLNKLRYNVYQFLKYTHQHNIPTIWAHPLYHYAVEDQPPFDFYNKMALIFERFEVLNGQRDTWQNMLVKNWISTITPEVIDQNAKRFGINLYEYSHYPYKKSMTGGSDDHMGIFAGQSGAYLYVPNLKERLKTSTIADLSLEALRDHRIVPYGGHQNIEKLTIAFLDYVFQVAINEIKPDLLRMLLHKGTVEDKILALVVSNLFSELKYHKTTMHFIRIFHQSFQGHRPKRMVKMLVKKVYKPVFDEAMHIVDAHDLPPDQMVEKFYLAINTISKQLNAILFKRLKGKIEELSDAPPFSELSLDTLLERIKISPNIRDFVENSSSQDKKQKRKITDFLDGLSFPFLSSTLILAANFVSSRVLYNNRQQLTDFSDHLGKLHHPKRMLWLTDSFDDNNGVSKVLQEMHREIKRLDLPIDMLVCSSTLEADDHLIVMRPEAEMNLPFYKEQTIRIPNVNDIHALFLSNEYDRLICSTEGLMGMVSVMLKEAYAVPAYFYIHTDWIMFARKALDWEIHDIDRVRRALRFFYGRFDKLFVLNKEHKKWLSGREMEIDEKQICQTAHWVDPTFTRVPADKSVVFSVDEKAKVLLYTGRLSKEKGVMDLIKIYHEVKAKFDDVVMVFAGTGPAEETLKTALPEAIFLGWVDSQDLPRIYSSADLLLLPSRFDTFGLVVLEAMSCGLPVISYNAKGPKDIIEHLSSGYIVSNPTKMAKHIMNYLDDTAIQKMMRDNAVERTKSYSKASIMHQFMADVGLA